MTNVINTLKHATLAASVAASVTTGAVAQDTVEAQNIAVANSYFTAVQTGDLQPSVPWLPQMSFGTNPVTISFPVPTKALRPYLA